MGIEFQNTGSATLPVGADFYTDKVGVASASHVEGIKLLNGTAGHTDLIPGGSYGLYTQGAVAEDAAVQGNPVLIGGRYDTTARTLDNGDAGAVALDVDGRVQISTQSSVMNLTFSLSAGAAYASGDVLADVQELSGAFRKSSGTGVLQSVNVIDIDDQAQALDLVIGSDTFSLGTENEAVSITDTAASNILGVVEVAAADYVDLVNSQVANIRNIGMAIQSASNTNLYIGAISRGTGTYTASGVTLRVGILQD